MDEVRGRWSEVEVVGRAVEVYQPPEVNPHGYVVVYLHGQGLARLDDKPAFLREFDRHGLPVVCPRSGPSWWTDRILDDFHPQISAERFVVEHVSDWIAQTLHARPPAIGLLGTSMGGQGALRITFKHPTRFPLVAAIAPAIDYHLLINEGDETLYKLYGDPETARQDTALLHVHPLNWPRNIWFCCDPADVQWRDGADRLRMKLAALGIPFECDLETSGGGHGFEYYNRMAPQAIGFLAARLDAERRRVV